jgi:hypothetical protein
MIRERAEIHKGWFTSEAGNWSVASAQTSDPHAGRASLDLLPKGYGKHHPEILRYGFRFH